MLVLNTQDLPKTPTTGVFTEVAQSFILRYYQLSAVFCYNLHEFLFRSHTVFYTTKLIVETILPDQLLNVVNALKSFALEIL